MHFVASYRKTRWPRNLLATVVIVVVVLSLLFALLPLGQSAGAAGRDEPPANRRAPVGTVVGWGYNVYGQATVPAGLSGVAQVAAGGYHSLALKSDGTVVAWGYNDYGQTSVPAGLSGVVQLAAGDLHNLALWSVPALSFTSAAPADGVYGSPYTHTFTAEGAGPVEFAVSAGSLPLGLSLAAATGVLSGTPTEAGPFGPIEVTASNASETAQQTFSLTIDQAPLSVEADSKSKVYGAPNPALTYTVSGLVNGDTESVLSGSLATTATIDSPVGSYPITQGTLSAANYEIAFKQGTLTVTEIPRWSVYLPLVVRP